MLIPVRCFTCNNPLANKWESFVKEVNARHLYEPGLLEGINSMKEKSLVPVFQMFGITRSCCKSHLTASINLMNTIYVRDDTIAGNGGVLTPDQQDKIIRKKH